MSTSPDVNAAPGTASRQHQPFVPPSMHMKEFTLRAVLLGLVMCVILGAANAYLGLRAGQTIAATYPAAVIGMAVLRVFKRHRFWKRISPERPARSANRWRPGAMFHHSGVRDLASRGWIFRRARHTGNRRR